MTQLTHLVGHLLSGNQMRSTVFPFPLTPPPPPYTLIPLTCTIWSCPTLCRRWANAGDVSAAQQTENICITFVQRRPNVEDVGPTLYKCYANVFCLLGIDTRVTLVTMETHFLAFRYNRYRCRPTSSTMISGERRINRSIQALHKITPWVPSRS